MDNLNIPVFGTMYMIIAGINCSCQTFPSPSWSQSGGSNPMPHPSRSIVFILQNQLTKAPLIDVSFSIHPFKMSLFLCIVPPRPSKTPLTSSQSRLFFVSSRATALSCEPDRHFVCLLRPVNTTQHPSRLLHRKGRRPIRFWRHVVGVGCRAARTGQRRLQRV